MLNDKQLQAQAALIQKMLRVSPYFTDVTVEVATHQSNSSTSTTYDIGLLTFIEVRYDSKHGSHDYLPGSYYLVGGTDNNSPDIQKIYSGKKRSIHQACVRIIARRYESELEAIMIKERDKQEKAA